MTEHYPSKVLPFVNCLIHSVFRINRKVTSTEVKQYFRTWRNQADSDLALSLLEVCILVKGSMDTTVLKKSIVNLTQL